MSCAQCGENRKDGAVPDCETGKGCAIPPLSPEEARVIKIRSMLAALEGLAGSQAVLAMYGASREDMELLAIVEEEIKRLREEAGGRH